MNLKNLLILFLIADLALSSCESNEEIDSSSSAQMMTGSDAELAIIMRQIHEDSKRLKKQISNSQTLGNVAPEYLREILSAGTTDTNVKVPLFDAFAETYIYYIEAIYSDTLGIQKELFNNAINTCVQCHGEFCPGPIKTIQKLEIQ